MDPNAAYRDLLAAIDNMAECFDAREPVDTYDIEAVIEHWRALDDWLKRGGFKPDAWK